MSSADLKTIVADNDTAFVVPKTVRVEGLVMAPLDIDIWGVVDGEVRCRHLVIHGSAQVLGTVVAERVEIYGQVRDGAIAARHIRIGSGCDVEAALYYSHLDIDEGGLFEGKTRRSENPMALFPPE